MSSAFFKKQTTHAFEEKFGIEQLAAVRKIRCVQVIEADDHSITLEKLNPVRATLEFWRRFGKEMASHHSVRGSNFGFAIDNHCGPTPQPNPEIACTEISWGEYFLKFRIENHLAHPRLKSVAEVQAAYQKCRTKLQATLATVTEAPSLLHGDFWSGNFLCVEESGKQVPVLIDPAPYWGHREADLAMSELFGGFAPDFYAAYEAELPLAPGYSGRKDIYQMYHLLNHWIIFGDNYRAQTLRLFEKLHFT